jgi:hypothetical protein
VGEDRDATQDAAQDRVTIQEAAYRLGVKEDAIRKRIQRGSMHHEKAEDGRVYVWVDATQDTRRASQDTTQDAAQDAAQDERLEDLKEQIGYLRRQLDEEREARRRADTIIAQLAKANEEQARTIRALEAPADEAASEPRESPETVEEEPEGAESRPATRGAQESTDRSQQRSGWLTPVDKLPWWHYVLGLLLVFLGALMLLSLSRHIPIRPLVAWQAIYLATGLLPPGVFGFWVGFRKRDPRLRSEVIRFGGLVGVAFFLGLLGDEIRWHLVRGESLVETFAGFGSVPLWIWAIVIPVTVLPGWLLYVSGALIGNAWQRHRTGRMTGTTPMSPLSRTTLASPEPHTDWTPRKQAYLGFAGTVVASLIGGLVTTLGATLGGS